MSLRGPSRGNERLTGDQPGVSLKEVRAARLRARAIRFGIGKMALGFAFLIGALSYALGPTPRTTTSTFWMTTLVMMSTFNVGFGLRTFARAHRRPRRGFTLMAYLGARGWWVLTLLWGLLATSLLGILLRQV